MTENFKKEGRVTIDGVNVLSCKYYLFRDKEGMSSDRSCGIGLTACKGKDCDFKEIANLQRENKEKINIIEQMIKILYPNASDDELYDVAFNGEYIDKLKELKDTADTMLMANDIKKQDIDSLREANTRLEQENRELRQVRKDTPDIQMPYVIMYRQVKKECHKLEQENKELSFAIEKCLENAGIECDNEEQALRSLPDLGASHYKILLENEERDFKINQLKANCLYNDLTSIEHSAKVVELEQENRELKEMLSKEPKAMQAFQTAYSGLKKDNEVLWEMTKDYKTALEEIKRTLLGVRGLSINCDKQIIKVKAIINEVLNDN